MFPQAYTLRLPVTVFFVSFCSVRTVYTLRQNRPHVSVSLSSTIQAHRAVDSALTTARFQAILQMPSAAF
jgi:hypothetical protein